MFDHFCAYTIWNKVFRWLSFNVWKRYALQPFYNLILCKKIIMEKYYKHLWDFETQPNAGTPARACDVHNWGHAEGFILNASCRSYWVVLGRTATLGQFMEDTWQNIFELPWTLQKIYMRYHHNCLILKFTQQYLGEMMKNISLNSFLREFSLSSLLIRTAKQMPPETINDFLSFLGINSVLTQVLSHSIIWHTQMCST